VRHMETRVLDRVEELAAQIDEMHKRLDAAGRGSAPPRPKGEPKGRRAKNPRKK